MRNLGKKWYASRTLWVNVVAVAGLVLNAQYGIDISPEEAGAIVVLVNLIMRAVTGEPLEL